MSCHPGSFAALTGSLDNALVLAFVFVGDGLRDAADPYSGTKK